MGLGQLYNGNPKKAIVAYILWLATAAFSILAPLSKSLAWPLSLLAVQLFFGLIVMVEAIYDALNLREITLRPYNRWYVYLGIILIHGWVIGQIQLDLVLSSTRAYKIPTQAMSPALEIGDSLVADMKAYEKRAPARGDVIILKYPNDESVPYVKRVIGLSGEKLEIANRSVYINGSPLTESYVQHTDPASIYEHWGPYTIPQNRYFVMGDNRDNSQDSRFWGYVKKHQVLGRATYLYSRTQFAQTVLPNFLSISRSLFMSKAFTLTNAKGGCGKATVALKLAICFARAGYRTLTIDLDQQGNLSAGLGVVLNKLNLTAHRLLINEVPEISRYIIEVRPQLKLLPKSSRS
jgi:signal peptidase I